MDLSSKIVMAAITMLIGAILIGVIATQSYEKVSKDIVSAEEHALATGGYPLINETAVYTVTNAPTGWKADDCLLTGFAVRNSSGSALTLTTDYTVDLTAGTYQLVNNDDTNTTYGLYGVNNKTYVDYQYCSDDYLNSSWSRSVFKMVAGFMALLLLVIAVYYFYSIYQEVKPN